MKLPRLSSRADTSPESSSATSDSRLRSMASLPAIEWGAALLLTISVLFLLVVRATHAGPLWRDECAVIQLATLPHLSDLWQNFQRESFPAVFPLLVRVYASCFGTSDVALRIFGLL